MKTVRRWRWLSLLLQGVIAAAAFAEGVSEEQWSPQERQFVEMARKQYAQQGIAFTQQQAETTVQSMRDQIARVIGAVGGLQAAARMQMPSTASVAQSAVGASLPASASMTEDQLAKAMSQWPAKPELFKVTERKDGFDINGDPVLDPEGRIFNYAVNTITGAATYAVQSNASVTIKSVAPAAPYSTVTIATGVQGANGWEFLTATGQRLAGSTLSVLSDGFMLGRGSAAFRYRAGSGISNVSIPNGYLLAPLQRGDIGSTGFVLLEKEGAVPDGKVNPLMGLISATQSLASSLGMGRKEDYALLDTQTGTLHALDIPADGKTVAVMSDCRKRNWAVNECRKMQTFESLYGTNGSKNTTHYFWKVQWLPTVAGPVALTQEDGLRAIYLTDLRTGRKVRAFHRTLGIADWDVIRHADGRVGAKARMLFEWQEIPDVVAFMQEAPDVGDGAKTSEIDSPKLASPF